MLRWKLIRAALATLAIVALTGFAAAVLATPQAPVKDLQPTPTEAPQQSPGTAEVDQSQETYCQDISPEGPSSDPNNCQSDFECLKFCFDGGTCGLNGQCMCW